MHTYVMSKKIEGRLIGKHGMKAFVAESLDLDVDPVGETRAALKEVFLEQLAIHGIYGKAAKAIGVKVSLVNSWRHRDMDFDEACMGAVEEACDRAEEVMVDLLASPRDDVKFNSAKFILQSKRREIYGQNVALTHEKKQPVSYVSRVPRAGIIDVSGQLVQPKPELADGEETADG